MSKVTRKTKIRRIALRTAVLSACFFAVFMRSVFAQNGGNGAADDVHSYFKSGEFDLDQAITANEFLLRDQPNSDFAPSIMFQLVELYYKRANDAYQAKMADYEAALQQHENDALQSEPVMPRVSFKEAISMGYRLLEQFPTAPFLDKVIYRLAICHIQEGNTDRAIEYLKRLTEEYRSSSFVDEANFRLGEQYFEQHNYARAVDYYSRLLNSWDSPFFSMALYKLAWAYYNLNDHSKAISTFVFLIDDLSKIDEADVDAEGASNADLRKEAISYVAESFAEHGGAKAAEKFLLDFGEKEYSKTIFIRLGEIYQERNFYDESNETYRTILRLWPLHHTAPEVQSKIIKNLTLTEQTEQAEKEREVLVAKYGPGSSWLMKHPEGEGREKALRLVEDNLYILGTDAQKRGMEFKSKRDLNLAIARYQEYIDKFPDGKRAAQVQFYQGEAYYELGDYANAAKAYEDVVVGYSKSEFAPVAAYNRVLSTFNILDHLQATSSDTITYYIEDFLGNGMTHPVRVPGSEFGAMLQACNDFAKYLPNDEKAPEVLMKFGEALFKLQRFDLAQEAYTMVVNRGLETPFTVQAYSMIAQSAFQRGDFLTAEKWYRKIATEYPDSARYVEKATTMMASAKFKMAENLKGEGKTELAAMAFQNIASSTDNPEIAERALLQAAVQFEETGNLIKAIAIYENLRYKLPNSGKIDEALYKAATLSEKLPDYYRAGQNYLELVRLRPNSVYASRALYNAALAFENSQNAKDAAIIYEQYANRYDDKPERHLEALIKAGEYAYEQQDERKARQFFTRAIKAYTTFMKAGTAPDQYLPAEAQFMLAQITFNKYRSVDIGKQFKRDYARKQQLLGEVSRACKSTINYKIADWTAAALYLMGSAWEEIARALYDAPRPQLNPDELAQYEHNLVKTLNPFKEKAINQYRANLSLAEKTNLNNEWVQKSRVRFEQLTIELGLAASNGSAAAATPKSNSERRATNLNDQ